MLTFRTTPPPDETLPLDGVVSHVAEMLHPLCVITEVVPMSPDSQ